MSAHFNAPDPQELAPIVALFQIPGRFLTAQRFGSGHINDTYLVRCEHAGQVESTVLQRINTSVFENPAALMENFARTVAHLHRKLPAGDARHRALTLVPARDGATFARDEGGGWWRATLSIPGTHTVDSPTTPEVAFQAARAFGSFLRLLGDLPDPRLHETIPGFHDTPRRIASLATAVGADPCNRAAGALQEIDHYLERQGLAGALLDPAAQDLLPERVTHNDTKVNNVLLDDASGEGVCVIDLDTVMPGLALWDFGDLVRSATSPVAEDEREAGRARVRQPFFEAVTRGFLAGTAGCLLPAEVERLVLGGKVITFECGVRFLTDHLEGDRYFRTQRPDQNLHRARTQLALLRSMEEQEDELQAIVVGVASQVGSS